jgi:hypothetical protein
MSTAVISRNEIKKMANKLTFFSFLNLFTSMYKQDLRFHGGDYDDYHLLGDDAVWLL